MNGAQRLRPGDLAAFEICQPETKPSKNIKVDTKIHSRLNIVQLEKKLIIELEWRIYCPPAAAKPFVSC